MKHTIIAIALLSSACCHCPKTVRITHKMTCPGTQFVNTPVRLTKEPRDITTRYNLRTADGKQMYAPANNCILAGVK